MSDTCPVCGKGDGELFVAEDLEVGSRYVSHLACVLQIREDAMKVVAELAALKRRRCKGCAERGGPEWNRYVCLLDDNCAEDFYCSYWTARDEEGGA